jgi:hypothetical protein
MSVVVCSVIHLSKRKVNSFDSVSCGSVALSSRRRICHRSVRCIRRRIGRRGACRVVHRSGRHIVQYIYRRSRSDRRKRSGCPCQDGARRRATC